jgi:hypothetical protein
VNRKFVSVLLDFMVWSVTAVRLERVAVLADKPFQRTRRMSWS